MVAPSAESPEPTSESSRPRTARPAHAPRAARALAALLALGLAACGGGAKGRAPAVSAAPGASFDSGGGRLEGGPGDGSPSGGLAEAPARQATSSSPAAPRAAERAEKKSEALADADDREAARRGLGTGFGETRRSRVHDVTFLREAERPFSLLSVRYDDRRGAERLGAFAAGGAARIVDDEGVVRLTVEDESGAALEGRRGPGGRAVVVGEEGQRYVLALENRSDHRIEAVVTVDGLDVVSGQPGTFSTRGYVLMPFQTTRIDGFRRSHDHVAAFRFSRTSESYAAQTGTARNVGVIGVALFSERGDGLPDREARLRATASPFPDEPGFAASPRR